MIKVLRGNLAGVASTNRRAIRSRRSAPRRFIVGLQAAMAIVHHLWGAV